MAKVTKRLVTMVPVEFRQWDMQNYRRDLPYPVHKLEGDSFFSEKVLWGEIWISSRTKRDTHWSGYILNGELFLDESLRNKTIARREPPKKHPSLLPVGKYKVWLDAWVRRK